MTTGFSLESRRMSHTYFLLYQNVPQVKKEEPPLSLYGQLLWREFFYTAATKNPNFDRMYGNPICVQIPWDKNPEVRAEKRKEFTPPKKTFQIPPRSFLEE